MDSRFRCQILGKFRPIESINYPENRLFYEFLQERLQVHASNPQADAGDSG